ncbi:MAG TPA: IS630 family transposase [Anaerohalosphaeraceae bacterium]|nr:IS630 family transposase [Anaerohalosphaeraceae bacterium]HRS71344.1 IS630 family transposase [Anaerohalosphaeraceae bacterium]
MDLVKARTLRPYERRKLNSMKHQLTNAVNSRHARMILLSRGSRPNRRIAEQCDCSPAWVRQIIHRFNDGGINGIYWSPCFCGPTGPKKFATEITEQIGEIALSLPKQLIGLSVWSLAKLRQYLIAQKIVSSISLEHLRQILRHRKINWRHTKTWKDSKAPDFWPKYRRMKRLDAKRPKGGCRISIDEFGPLNLLSRHGRHYAQTGHVNRLRATYNRPDGVRYLFGAYDLERDTLVGPLASKKNGTTFLAFLKWVRQRYPRKETLPIILDNATYHRKAEVLAYAATHKIKFYWTPTNASWLNRIECHFTALKKFALDNTDYRSHAEQQEAIEHYLSWRNRKRDISMQDWKTYRRHKKGA